MKRVVTVYAALQNKLFHYFISLFMSGVALEGGKKKYTQTTERPVHISMAALDPVNTNGKCI
jgi:hypothetical protein